MWCSPPVPHRTFTRAATCGSVDVCLAGLELLEGVGAEEIRRRRMALAEDLIEGARDGGLRPKVAASPEDRSAIVMLPSADPPAAVRRLADAGIVTDSRPGH